MNGYEKYKYAIRVDILYRLVPQLTPLDFFSWDVVHWHELGGVHMRGEWKKKFFQFFFICFLGKSIL